jgi:hypothetical protein
MSDLISRALIWQNFGTYERDISIKNGKKEHLIQIVRNHFCVRFAKSRDVKLFQKPRSHLELLGAGWVIRRMFHAEDLQGIRGNLKK